MRKFAIKHVITNDKNSNKILKWFFYDSKEEKDEFLLKQSKQVNDWNCTYHPPDGGSIRSQDYAEFTAEDVLNMDFPVEGMKLKDVVEFLK